MMEAGDGQTGWVGGWMNGELKIGKQKSEEWLHRSKYRKERVKD